MREHLHTYILTYISKKKLRRGGGGGGNIFEDEEEYEECDAEEELKE